MISRLPRVVSLHARRLARAAAMLLAAGALLPTPEDSSGSEPAPIRLTDVTHETGITFVHTDGGTGQRWILETVASGLATFDYDGDGDVDIYFLNGAPMPGAAKPGPPPRNALYRNDGGWKFTDVTDLAGVGDTGHGLGVCVGDYDGDGHPDLYLNNAGPNVLYRNNGDGTFTDVTAAAGVANGNRIGAGAAFFDMDGDGDLDLYVANYIDFTPDRHEPRFINGHPAYSGPMAYGPVPDTLYRNNGDGTFTDVSRESGIAARAGTGMGLVCADIDDDGDTDVIVGNDAMANFVWINDGAGRFTEMGLLSGLAYDAHGIGQGTMGVDCGDYDNDGRLDFHMTSYQKQWAVLYRGVAPALFEDVTARTGGGAGSYHMVTWGNGLIDFNNDGHRDLFMACGHLQDNVELWDDTVSWRARNLLLLNTGGGRFIDVSSRAGSGLEPLHSSRGAAFDDLDNDGDIDVVILNSREQPTILRNDSPPGNHWVRFRLRGARANRNGVGARIRVRAGGLDLVAEVHAGRGYQSHFGTDPHFGLGTNGAIDQVVIRWPGGGTDLYTNLPADRVHLLTEGAAPADTGPAP